MATHGNASQWENTYPSPQLILDDITEGNSYVCTEQDQIIATFYYKEGADPTYIRIYDGDWINDSRYGVVPPATSSSRKCKRCSVLLPELGFGTMRQYPY